MVKYVLGFMFNESETDVLLIQKNKPAWQINKFNGIGGKCEYHQSIEESGDYSKRKSGSWEPSLSAIIREFEEETGIKQTQWEPVITMAGGDWIVDVFTCKGDVVFDAKTMEDEEVYLLPISELDKYDLIPNLSWLIPMCLDKRIDYTVSNKTASATPHTGQSNAV
jgi:8-oxo-dGTP pyrophosphatase MutT (NUDIX family)